MARRRRRTAKPRCSTCGKVRFRTELEAKLAVAGGAGDKGSVRVYPCSGGWHTTSEYRPGK